MKNPTINYLSAIIILLMLSFQLQAKEISAPSNPKKYSESIKAITLKIIDNKPTDDAKLEAIYDWIIYRIEYNVEKFLTNDFSTVSNVEVVKYRQAVCTGYASLMDEMCYWAGIKCVTINGYAKTENVDLGDKFYVASHCWNAVQLGNQWYFVDATWDAGYIQYTKHLFLSKKVKFSPRFVASPNKNYFKKSASDFMKDHLPLNSNWQLTDKKMSINKFEKDSSAYLGVNHFSNSVELPLADNQNYLLNYAAENNWEQTIDDGKDGFTFNNKNFICKAEQYAAKMNLLKEDLKVDKELIAADTVALNEISKNAKFAADTFLLMKNKLGEMKNELMNNNKLKGKIISSENGELLSINKKIVSSINRTQKKLKTQSKANKLLMKQNDNNVDQFLSSLNFYKTTFSKNAKADDTLGLEEKIDKLKDSVKIATDEYLKLTQSFNDLYDADITKLERYDELTKKGITDLKQAMDMRQQMIDDLDYPIQTLKTKFIKRQNMADELLLNGKIFFTDSLFKLFKQIQLQHIKVVNYQKHILKLDKKMRKYKAESTAQIQIYLDAMSGMETFVYRHKDFIRKFSSKGKLMNKQFKKRLTTNKQENKHLQTELQLEKMLNKARGRMILKQNTGYNKFCKSQASACIKQIKLDNRLKVKAAKK